MRLVSLMFLMLCSYLLVAPASAEVPFASAPFDVNNIPEPVPPQKEVRDFFDLDPYYQQWINVRGFPVLASAEVSPYTVKEAAWQIGHMVGHRPDILKAMAQIKARFSIVPHNKHLPEIPEYDWGRLNFFWEMRARGVGGLTTTSPEENIICGDNNYCYAELIHEFAHQLHGWGLNRIDSTFDNRLETMYNAALKEGLYQNRYAGSNRWEYWAEGVGSWFNGPHPDNVAHTRLALKEYDPRLAQLLTEVFGDGSWRYTPPATRTDLPHLQGFNPQDAPIYQRPPELLELEKQMRDPNSDGGGKWVNLTLYHPSALSHLKDLTTGGNRTEFLFGKLTGTDLALYFFNADGKKILYQYVTTPDFLAVHTAIGAIWLIQDHTGKDLAVFRAEKQVGRVLVTPNLHLITPGLSIVSGDNQSGVSGTVLANPFVVEVRAENLSVLEGISVTFTVMAGNGTLSARHTTTDENGRAESTLTLGPDRGTNTVSVSAAGIAESVIFNAMAEAAVAIPDINLSTAVNTALGKPKGNPITPSEMATLPRLVAQNANISDLTGLEHATNLTDLLLGDTHVEGAGWINSNSIKDLSPLAGLTNLTSLNLSQNNIADLSPLAELTNLTWLDIGGNNLSNISPVSGLINLTALRLWRNNISDISAVADLTRLTEFNLDYNNISDISAVAGLTSLRWTRLVGNNISDLSPLVANTGLGNGDEVYVQGNPLSYQSIHTHIPALQSRGIAVSFDTRTATKVRKLSGDNQRGKPRAALDSPFVVEVWDQHSRPFEGVPVTFEVTEGGGSLSITNTHTDADGRAQSTLTLGADTGTNTVSVRVEGISESVTFDAVITELVVIPDDNLRAKIEDALGKASGATITTADMAQLTSLDVQNANITDLTGLETATNLTWLTLNYNNVSDLSPLEGLINLMFLWLDGNNISDLSPLVANTGLGNGDIVIVNTNPLSAVSIKTHIPALESRGVRIPADIPDDNLRAAVGDALGKAKNEAILRSDMAKLLQLIASDSNISDLTGLEHATNLTSLNLRSNNISDISPLEGLTKLTSLSLDSNAISDISPLSGLTNLTYLSLSDTGISDISLLAGLTNLTRLELGSNAISNISPLAELTNLTALFLEDNAISDISGVAELTNLAGLKLGSNAISDISGVTGLTKLEVLDLSDTGISDISGVAGLTNLTSLDLANNAISDISGVAGLTKLKELYLFSTGISDISPLEGLTNLTRLWLGSNAISDISPLVANTGLGSGDEIDVRENPLSYLSIHTHIPTLEARGVDVAFDSRIPTTLLKISGDDQKGVSGETLANPFVVEVRDEWNRAFAGIEVTFAVTAGGGTLSVTSTETAPNGRAESTLTLGSDAGTNTVTVSVEGIAETTTFNAEASLPPPIPTSLEGISGNNQTDLTGETLMNPFVVEVRDQYDDPMEGVTVAFVVSAGGGLLSHETVLTDANGRAESTLTLGSDPGTNTVKVSVEGIAETATFNAEASLPPPIPTSLEGISGNNQTDLTGERLMNPFVVEVRDQYDDPMEGVTIAFVVSAGGGLLSHETVLTDANGRAESTLTLGNEPGTNTVTVSVEGITDFVDFNAIAELREFDLSVPSGLSLIHIPLKVTAVDGAAKTLTSIANLYDALGGASTVNFLITYDSSIQEWRSYFVPSDKGSPADRGLTDDMGIIAGMKVRVSLRLRGTALGTDGNSTITLNKGLNLVGIPLRDERINRVSDLLRLDGIWGNVPVIVVTDGGDFKVVGRAGDPGDIAITGGQAFIMTASQEAVVNISGDAWANDSGTAASPSLSLKGIEVGNTTPVLGLKGSFVDEKASLDKSNFRVTVKNLSTGKAVTGMTKDEGSGYRLTVVDIDTGRAATIGDILEISAQSPHPFIGVEPLTYTVTAEDVKRSLIQLPELVTYEIPAETALLHNYPNPFNPETWIPYRLAEDGFVTLTIYDQSGRVVRALDVGHRIAAVYESRSKAIYWDGRNEVGETVGSGVYFYHLSAGDYSATRKLVILK